MDVGDFNKCCLAIYALFERYKRTISINDLSIVFDKLGRDNLQKTLDLLSIDIFQAKNKSRTMTFQLGHTLSGMNKLRF